jgi:hypothetical protein
MYAFGFRANRSAAGSAWIAQTTVSNRCSVQHATFSRETESLLYGLSFQNQLKQLKHFDRVIYARSPLRALV